MPSKKIKENQGNLEQRIVDLLKESPQGKGEIFKRLKIKKKRDYKIAKRILEKLEKKKQVARDGKSTFKISSSKDLIQGKITITSQGFGFVKPLNSELEEDIFIPARHIHSSFDGDLVKVRIMSKSRQTEGKGPVGVVYEVVERNRPEIVGELVSGKDGLMLRTLSRKVRGNIKIYGPTKGAQKGDWVKASLIYGGRKSVTTGEIIEVIGKTGDINNDMFAIIQEYNILPSYTQEELNRADSLKQSDIKREDLTSLFSITIDPHDAKDFDDAISVSPGKRKDECIMGIHIADVASWVQPESWIDIEAASRGFTSYIPGYTLPMLPKNLTKKISLTSDKISDAHTVLLTINTKNGEIINYHRCHSKIDVRYRLTYMEVEDYIKNKIVPENWSRELTDNLDKLLSVYRIFRENRKKQEQFLEIATTEIRVLRNDDTGEILGIERKKQGEANQLVEEFMLAANSAVAKEMTNNRIPGIYRTHPEPEEEKLEEFSNFVYNVFNISTGNLASGRKACQHFLSKMSGNKYEEIIISNFLRALNRALYSEKSALHFGLGKGLYCHFTSPIRRYTDLTVHQQLWKCDTSKKLKSEVDMAKVALDCTEKEKNNDEAFFAANDRLKLHYLLKLMKEEKDVIFEGIIRTISSGTLIADIPAIGLVGCIPSYYLRQDRQRDERSKSMQSKKSFNLKSGDFVSLKLEEVDLIKGDAIFRPVLDPE